MVSLKAFCCFVLLELPIFPIAFPFQGDGNMFVGTILLWQFFLCGLLWSIKEISEEITTKLVAESFIIHKPEET